MTVKWQHYVPQVYLKAWETQVVSKKEPNKPFRGIYYFEKVDLSTGDGRNKDSVLCASRIYTIKYNLSFIIPSCPMIEKDYIKQIEEKLNDRGVHAYFEGKKLKTRKDLAENFLKLDEWEFKYKPYPFNSAKKNAILNELKQTSSYVIENALDDFVEKKWEQTLNDFLYQMENTIPLNGIDEVRRISEDTVLEVVKMIIFLICRNPQFNYLGILPRIKKIVLDSLPEALDAEGSKARETFIQNQMDAIWLAEIYNGLFNVPSGYFHTIKKTAQNSFQLMLYKTHENQGEYLTSDTPAFEHISLVEIPNLNSIICPLTPQYILLLMKGESNSLRDVNFRLANTEVIRRLNRIILNHANTAVVSTQKHLGYIL